MQDVTPRGQLRSTRTSGSAPLSSRPERTFYSRRTRVTNDMFEVTESYETLSEPAPMTRGAEHLSPEAKTLAMERALQIAQKELRSERRKQRDLRRFGVVFVASIFVLATGYVSIDTIVTNNRVKAESTSFTPLGSSSTDTAAQEGKDETRPAVSALDSYVVSRDKPRALYIDKLSIAARILPMSVNANGSIQAPQNIFDAGWYTSGAAPGDDGAVFIDGHASGTTREGLFAYLDTLKEGDTFQVEMGDGTKLNYVVRHTDVVGLHDIDMKKMLQPYDGVTKGLNLMTCTGTWVESEKTYDHRVIVWAEQV